MMMFLKITADKDWDCGIHVRDHLVEIDQKGFVTRFIDLDQNGSIVDFSPSWSNVHGVTDHPPFSMECDWNDKEIEREQFESLWAEAQAADKTR
jgi:hypothetical protein